MPRAKKVKADPGLEPGAGPTPREVLEARAKAEVEASPDVAHRLNVLEQGMAKIIEHITGGNAAPDGVEPQGGAPSQRGELIQLLQAVTKPPTADPYMDLAKQSLQEDLMLSRALRYSLLKGMGIKIGKKAIGEMEDIHVVTEG